MSSGTTVIGSRTRLFAATVRNGISGLVGLVSHGLLIRALDGSVIELVRFQDTDRLVPPALHLADVAPQFLQTLLQ